MMRSSVETGTKSDRLQTVTTAMAARIHLVIAGQPNTGIKGSSVNCEIAPRMSTQNIQAEHLKITGSMVIYNIT